MESKLVLVTNIKELSPGVRIVIKPINCGMHLEHEYMVFNPDYNHHVLMVENGVSKQHGYEVLPCPSCKPGPGNPFIYQWDIDKKIVYKYIDLDDIYESDELKKNILCEDMASRKKSVKI